MTIAHNILYIAHGAGPLPLLGDPEHDEMIAVLKAMAEKVGTPSAVLVISAHWEAKIPTITSGSAPGLIYDYSGFPPESYDIQYPCAGEPRLAQAVYQALSDAGIKAHLDEQRGFDHGLYVPLKLMYPEANIPCIQLSLMNSLDANKHLAVGAALQALAWDHLLVVGSGFSFHNMRAFFSEVSGSDDEQNSEFQAWLTDTITNNDLSVDDRLHRLENWDQAPYARFCHPREEHLLPLHICYAMAASPCRGVYDARVINKQSTMFHW